MSEIIAVCNQKGGVGKSTTAVTMAAGLTLKGFNVLLIDLDAQCNTTYSSRASKEGGTSLGLLLNEGKIQDAIQRTSVCDVVAGSKALAGADAYLTETGREYRLRDALEPVADLYDYIVIDTPPALGVITTNALTAATKVIIPAQADIYSIQGIADLSDTIRTVRKYCNRELKVEGILLTRYSSRPGYNQEIMELACEIAKNIGTKVFKATIREAISVKKAQAAQQTLYESDPKGKVTQDYESFLQELIGKE